jgi:aspartate aminotransferase
MTKVQSQSTSNPTSISQVAAQAALDGDQGCIAPMLKAFKERHDFVYESLQSLDGVSVVPGDGTFYTFPNFQQIIDRLGNVGDDIALAEYLLNEAEISLVPGSAFGADGCMRISFATSMANLVKAMERLRRILGQ